ncbi:hypothetical protein POM88_008599 [Heracleum sosnowskyi]|uniref:Uncharacterized protein n=1 Tax=Heracleum sosnowskyi TaxID=360622 RepID=A0AAD8J7Q5_9APIA|nr:hypothetical protein POM88_008599 [Heracleum sosnowskyi]
MASNTNFSFHETEVAGMINQSNTHQMEAPAEDTSNDLTPPMCRGGTTAGRVVVFGVPLDQSYFSRGKKASGQRVKGSRSTSKGKNYVLLFQLIMGIYHLRRTNFSGEWLNLWKHLGPTRGCRELRDDELMKLTEEARLADFTDKEIDVDGASDQLALRMLEEELTRINMEFEELVASPLY